MNDTARKIDLSVVIVYTNVAQLNEAVSYIEKQSIYPSVETVLLDNRENRFTSAASALNYGADICFHNLTNGGENYIYSADGCHESTGNAFNSSFRKTLKAIVLKYKGKLPRIQTTCVNIKCSMPAYRVYCCKSYIMQMKRRIFG